MRKDVVLPALSVVGGVAGFLLRRWQLASAYQPETGLFAHGAPATCALLGLFALLALAFLALVWKKTEGGDDFLPAFGSPDAGQMAVLAAAGLLLLAAGALGVKEGLSGFQLWRAAPELYRLSNPAARLLAALLCLPAGIGTLLMGRMAYRWELNTAGCFLAPFPALAGLVWLFADHLEYGIEPVLMKYGIGLFAALLLTLAHYYVAGFLFGQPRRRRALFCALMGVVLGVTSLADTLSAFTVAVVALTLSAVAFARALLAAPWPERMPPSEEVDGSDGDESTNI